MNTCCREVRMPMFFGGANENNLLEIKPHHILILSFHQRLISDDDIPRKFCREVYVAFFVHPVARVLNQSVGIGCRVISVEHKEFCIQRRIDPDCDFH